MQCAGSDWVAEQYQKQVSKEKPECVHTIATLQDSDDSAFAAGGGGAGGGGASAAGRGVSLVCKKHKDASLSRFSRPRIIASRTNNNNNSSSSTSTSTTPASPTPPLPRAFKLAHFSR